MLHLLRGADESHVANRRVGNIADDVRGFGSQAVDHLAGFCVHYSSERAKQGFNLRYMAPGLFQVSAESVGQLCVS